ncbi:mitochondrial GTPase 1 [Galendromus occidentalis]|uniref:Mitochondrial GTPase 1 n=1 Tax=Galendromus occidentalis TaxID=34638 RepID=A0AAJ6QY02_9ACAR|nr:mitochondrial GTPase 1 [Galendromus occidentalis]
MNVLRKGDTAIISRWFPSVHGGAGGMAEVQRKLTKMDCIIEVHDARVPLSGRNQKFLERLRAARPHLLVYNKVDTIPRKTVPYLKKIVTEKESSSPFPLHGTPLFCSATKNKRIDKIVPKTVKLIHEFFKHNADFAKLEYTIMIVGVPNVGKSSIINAVRETCTGLTNMATRVGAQPGITRSVLQTIRVSQHPKIYLVDSPGVLEPTPVSYERALRLALCGTAIDSLVGNELMAAYLFNFMQTRGITSYCNYMGFDKPVDSLPELLRGCASMLQSRRKTRNFDGTGGYSVKLDLELAAKFFIMGFRRGEYGKILLDDEDLPSGVQGWEVPEAKDVE